MKRLEYRKLKAHRLEQKKLEHRKLKKAFKKTMINLAQSTIGLELTDPENISSPQGEISYMDVQHSE